MQDITLKAYWNILWKRRLVVIMALSITVLVTVAVSILMKPTYRAGCTVMVERENSNNLFLAPVLLNDTAEYMATQMQVVQSRAVAKAVVQRFHLEEQLARMQAEAGSFTRVVDGIKGLVKGIRSAAGHAETDIEADPISEMAGIILKFLRVEAARDTRIMTISYDSADPRFSAAMANAFAETYIRLNLETKLKPARENLAWLTGKLQDLEKKVGDSAGEAQKYRESAGIATADERLNISMQKLNELNSQLLAAEARRYDAESRYKQLTEVEARHAPYDTLPEVINNSLIQALKANQARVAQDMTEISRKYGRQHPQYQRLDADSQTLKANIDQEAAKIVASMKNEYEVALKREKALRAALSEQNRNALGFGRKAIELKSREESARVDRDVYDVLLKKLNELSLSSGYNMTNIVVVDQAEPPVSPVGPRIFLNILLAVFLGTMLGVGLALLLEMLDGSIKTPEDIEAAEVTLLGAIPVFEREDKKG